MSHLAISPSTILWKGESDEDDDDGDNEFSESDLYNWDNGYKNKVYIPESELTVKQRAGKDIIEFLKIFTDDDFKSLFGDHVKVVVTRKGVSTDDYDHD